VPCFTFANEHEREVRQRCKVSARADRSSRGHDGVDATIEQIDQQLQRFEANP
jgi:hypothetical protein